MQRFNSSTFARQGRQILFAYGKPWNEWHGKRRRRPNMNSSTPAPSTADSRRRKGGSALVESRGRDVTVMVGQVND